MWAVLASVPEDAIMELSTKGRYAVMAMADLAQASRHAASGSKSVTLAEISARQEISQSYLEQLFGRLRRAGLVAATRGPGGGYRLAKSTRDIVVADIMRAVEEPLKATRCDAQVRAGCLSGNRKCLTHDLWDELSSHIAMFLSAVSLEDVVERRLTGRVERLAGVSTLAAQ
jgi:Rrf2 family transcriptional regulator, iron-sulfur cluster assembly transcription factor